MERMFKGDIGRNRMNGIEGLILGILLGALLMLIVMGIRNDI